MSNTEAENITEELSNLLRQSKQNNNYKDESDGELSEPELNVSEIADSDDENNNNDSMNTELKNAITDLRKDILNILEMLNALNSETEIIKEKINNMENNKSKVDTNDIQEQIDKILSVKLDELTQKVNKKIKKYGSRMN